MEPAQGITAAKAPVIETTARGLDLPAAIGMNGMSSLTMLQQRIGVRKLSFGCAALDAITHGGLPVGLTEVSGEAGCGKTQICLNFSIRCGLPLQHGGLNGTAAYLSCGEGEFPVKRLSQMASSIASQYGTTKEALMDKIQIMKCLTTEDILDTVFKKLSIFCQEKNVKVLIMDSLAGLVRTEYDTKTAQEMGMRTTMLFALAAQLKRLSDTYQLCVLIVNQVSGSGFDDHLDRKLRGQSSGSRGSGIEARLGGTFGIPADAVPALGLAWSHCVTNRWMLRRNSNNVRSLVRSSSDEDDGGYDNVAVDENQPTAMIGGSSGDPDSESIYTNSASNTGHREAAVARSRRRFTVVFSPVAQSASTNFEIQNDGIRGVP